MNFGYRTSTERRHPVEGWTTPIEWVQIVLRAGRRCFDCGAKFSKKNPATRGHRVPVTMGGTGWPSNVIPQCGSCNSRQGNKVHASAQAAPK